MKSKILFLLILIGLGSLNAFSRDVKDTLSWSQFKQILVNHHPIAKRAILTESLAKVRMNQAWGNFDPKVSVNFDQKEYAGTNYYRFLTPEIKLPLWYGMELKGNYSEAEGTYLNPENKLPQEGLSFVGLNVSLGKGLLIDKRRAVLKQAQIFTQFSKNEQLRIINDLIFDAGIAYLNWQNKYKITKVYSEALKLSEIRYKALKESFAGGDRAAIDTLEALTLIQQRQIQLQQTQLDFQYATFELGSYLWLSGNNPSDLTQINFIPQADVVPMNTDLNPSINNNPKLLSYNYKLKDLTIERKLKSESLRPTLDLQLGILNNGNDAFRNLNSNYWTNNNKIGIQFSFPLTFTTARADLAEAKLKIIDTQIEQDLVKNDLSVKWNQNQAENETLQKQLDLVKQSLKANRKLLEGEELKFKFGDSSIFLINARESKVVEAQEKLLETENKIAKNKLKADWIVGGLTN
jgi:outer membrane protein TolC